MGEGGAGVKVPPSALGEGFRVRAAKLGCTRYGVPAGPSGVVVAISFWHLQRRYKTLVTGCVMTLPNSGTGGVRLPRKLAQ